MRRLIINADDFGLTSGVNRAIVEAHTRGVVTSATLMANGAAFEDAVTQGRSSPNLHVGCHVVLTDGVPILGASQVPSLMEGSRFREDFGSFAVAAISGRLNSNEIEAEATAQIRRLQSAGIHVSHIDTHKHTHLFPKVMRALLRAAKNCGVRGIRNPFGPVTFSSVAKRPDLWKRYGQVKLFCGLAGKFQRTVEKAGMKTPDGTVGVVGTGAMDEQLLQSVIRSLPNGTWELVCHPGYNDSELHNVKTRLRESREKELELLTSTKTRELLAESDIELISYRTFT